MKKSLIMVEQPIPHVTAVILNRPDKRNALTIQLMDEICAAVEKASADKSQRVIVLYGAGKSFCAGLDMEEASQPELTHASGERIAKLLHTVANSPLITIAAVHGAAIAGGAGLMTACDLAIVTEDTKIGYPEVRRGLVAGLVMTFLLRQISLKHINELLLLGELIDAERAASIGLVNRVVAGVELIPVALRYASSALQSAPGAIAHTKKMLNTLHGPTVDDALQKALTHHLDARISPEALEGIKSFLEKRDPSWAKKSTL